MSHKVELDFLKQKCKGSFELKCKGSTIPFSVGKDLEGRFGYHHSWSWYGSSRYHLVQLYEEVGWFANIQCEVSVLNLLCGSVFPLRLSCGRQMQYSADMIKTILEKNLCRCLLYRADVNLISQAKRPRMEINAFKMLLCW